MVSEELKILVVDDEESVRRLLKRTLEEAGYAVATAGDGQEALQALSPGDIQVVLLDIKMPGISGIDVLNRITAERPDICVVMATAVVDTGVAVEALKNGAYDYILKPFSREDILKKVAGAVARWREKIHEKHHYLELKQKMIAQTRVMQEQFEELVNSLAREHKLIHDIASKNPGYSRQILSGLPLELQARIETVEEFRDALLSILKKA